MPRIKKYWCNEGIIVSFIVYYISNMAFAFVSHHFRSLVYFPFDLFKYLWCKYYISSTDIAHFPLSLFNRSVFSGLASVFGTTWTGLRSVTTWPRASSWDPITRCTCASLLSGTCSRKSCSTRRRRTCRSSWRCSLFTLT